MVVPASNSHTIDLEMQHVSEWAQLNNLRLNTTKSVELIIHRPGVMLDKLSVPPPTLGLTRKTTTKILGVTITDTLSFSPHITDVIARCSQTNYALRILRAHGLNGPALWNITRSTLISKLLYASPVWFGYLDKGSRDRCQGLLNRLKRWGFLGKDFDNFITLCKNADDVLFSALLLNENHVLHQLLPPVKCTQYNLRNRPYNYTSPKVRPAVHDMACACVRDIQFDKQRIILLITSCHQTLAYVVGSPEESSVHQNSTNSPFTFVIHIILLVIYNVGSIMIQLNDIRGSGPIDILE